MTEKHPLMSKKFFTFILILLVATIAVFTGKMLADGFIELMKYLAPLYMASDVVQNVGKAHIENRNNNTIESKSGNNQPANEYKSTLHVDYTENDLDKLRPPKPIIFKEREVKEFTEDEDVPVYRPTPVKTRSPRDMRNI